MQDTDLTSEVIVYGVAASSGIAIGRAFVFEDDTMLVTKRRITAKGIPNEIKRFRKAIAATHKDLNKAEANVLRTLGKEHARLLEAHRLILDDPALTKDVARMVEEDGVNAEFALSEVLSRINVAFEAIRDEFFRERRHDLFDVGRRVLQHLQKSRSSKKTKERLLKDSVVVARNLMPTDTLHFKEQKIQGFVTELGGRTSHVAILASALEISAVVGASDVLAHISTGDEIIVDGTEGVIIIRPTIATLKTYTQKQSSFLSKQQELLVLTKGPARTADGFTLTIAANLDTIEELPLVKKFAAQEIGLFRTELVCLTGSPPLILNEKAQIAIYRKVLEEMAPHSVVIRLLDIGADKIFEISPELINPKDVTKDSSSYLSEEAAATFGKGLPMGLRGIRLILRYPKILKTQLRAILSASPYGNPKILLPMVSAIEEVREVKWLLEEIMSEFDREGIAHRKDIPLGIMVEVPSVAIKVEAFLAEVDFVSVGTNDLVQYTLACDRSSAELAYLYQEFHPSVLQLLYNVSFAAHNLKRWVGICGELASNPFALPLLLGMGFDGFSVNPHLIPSMKKHLRTLTLEKSKFLVKEALKMTSHEDVLNLLKREIVIEA